MHASDLNWMQMEAYLKKDDRAILPLGSFEQHAYLSLGTDMINAERLCVEASEPEGVPVFPVIPYGLTPQYKAYPGSINIRVETYCALIADVMDSLARHGFKRILVVNGHGGNQPAAHRIADWMGEHPEVTVKFHAWWLAPGTVKAQNEIDTLASHASWMENYPWTLPKGVSLPDHRKPLIDYAKLRQMNSQKTREYVGDGNYGGSYYKPEADMKRYWAAAVEEIRNELRSGWI